MPVTQASAHDRRCSTLGIRYPPITALKEVLQRHVEDVISMQVQLYAGELVPGRLQTSGRY